jgi:multiple sugar transport system ATP-binding protein
VTSGTIHIGDRLVNNLPPAERDIAMVFQNYALYPHKTVAANMAFSLRMRNFDKAEIEKRVARAAEVLGLTPYLDRYPRALSGGQRQRVAMGRAIVRDPQVFLFDEPLSNLDAKLRVQMRAEIRELHQRLRSTTVYVTHDQIEAMTMADKIVVMHGGHISQVGSPLELYDRPANTFVAGFIGSPSMNLIDATIRHVSGAVVAEVGGVQLPLHDRTRLEDGRAVKLGVRPENLLPGEGGLPATVAVIEPTGAETHLVCRVGTQELTSVLRERSTLRPGQEISLTVAPGAIHLFDQKTGLRID